jgi:hypothetical protein
LRDSQVLDVAVEQVASEHADPPAGQDRLCGWAGRGGVGMSAGRRGRRQMTARLTARTPRAEDESVRTRPPGLRLVGIPQMGTGSAPSPNALWPGWDGRHRRRAEDPPERRGVTGGHAREHPGRAGDRPLRPGLGPALAPPPRRRGPQARKTADSPDTSEAGPRRWISRSGGTRRCPNVEGLVIGPVNVEGGNTFDGVFGSQEQRILYRSEPEVAAA